jgi:hypothetical protein
MCALVKVSINFRAEKDLRDEIRGAVIAVQRVNPNFSRDAMMKMGARLALKALEKRYNAGERFRRKRQPLTAGKRPNGE